MQERKVLVTYEAIYDIVEAEEYKKPYPPAIIFWIAKEDEIHILRIPREEYNWQGFFSNHIDYEYTYPEDKSNSK